VLCKSTLQFQKILFEDVLTFCWQQHMLAISFNGIIFSKEPVKLHLFALLSEHRKQTMQFQRNIVPRCFNTILVATCHQEVLAV